jgi:mutual gliding-motility protein MglA
LDIKEIPLILQYNKRDLPSAMPLQDLRFQLNKFNSPEFEAKASEGVGVMESLNTCSRAIINILQGGSTI